MLDRSVAAAALFILLCLGPANLHAAPRLNPCFTPGQDCTGFIVNSIESAQKDVLVQAYGLTSCPIITALGRAKSRGLNVQMLLDRSNEQRRYAGVIVYLRANGIEPLIDERAKIAHNKVIILDRLNVVTGSFNFTKSAQTANAENVLLIRRSRKLARQYVQYWNSRAALSRPAAQPDQANIRPFWCAQS